MKKTLLATVVGLGLAGSVHAVNYLVNGDFSQGETGWTQCPGVDTPSNPSWTATSGTYGTVGVDYGTATWYQTMNIAAGEKATISGKWAGNLTGDYWWTEVMFFSMTTSDTTAINVVINDPALISNYGGVGGTATKIACQTAKGIFINYDDNTWDWQSIADSPYGDMTLTSQGYVIAVLKLGGSTKSPRTGAYGTVSFTDLQVIPEPASLGLLALGAMAFLGRRRKQ